MGPNESADSTSVRGEQLLSTLFVMNGILILAGPFLWMSGWGGVLGKVAVVAAPFTVQLAIFAVGRKLKRQSEDARGSASHPET